MYGSRVFFRIPEERRRSKWDKKAEVWILLGYTNTEYRVLLNNKVIVARNCDIIEKDVKLCGFEVEEENKIEGKEKENQDKIPQEKRDDNVDTDETDVTESKDERN